MHVPEISSYAKRRAPVVLALLPLSTTKRIYVYKFYRRLYSLL